MTDPFARAARALFRRLGKPADYLPAEGEPVPVKVIRKQPTEEVGVLGTTLATDTSVFDVLVQDVPSPAKGDRLAFQGVTYVVQGKPVLDDPGVIWTLDAVPE